MKKLNKSQLNSGKLLALINKLDVTTEGKNKVKTVFEVFLSGIFEEAFSFNDSIIEIAPGQKYKNPSADETYTIVVDPAQGYHLGGRLGNPNLLFSMTDKSKSGLERWLTAHGCYLVW